MHRAARLVADGSRIAYLGEPGGQRDIWTIAMHGGQPSPLRRTGRPTGPRNGRQTAVGCISRAIARQHERVARRDRSTHRGAWPGDHQQPPGIAYARFASDQRRLSVMAYSRSFELSVALIDIGAEVRVCASAIVRSPSLGW